MTSYFQSLASWYYWWTAQPPPSTDLYRRHPSSLVIEITEINVQNLPSSASSVQVSAGHREDSGIQSAAITPGQSLNWFESEFRQQKLAVRPSSTLYLRFHLGRNCIFEIEVPFSEIIAGFSSDLETNACIYTAKDIQGNPVELQVKLVIHERPDVLLYDSISNLANDDNSLMSQLSTLFKAYITLERTYNGHRRVHPLVKAFISPTLSQIWSTNLRSVQNPPPPRSSPPFRETGQSRPRTTPRPLLEIVLGMNDLIPSLMTRSYTLSQEHQDLLNRVFAELCRCTALLEEVDGAHEEACIASKDEQYRERQEQLFILLYKITCLLHDEVWPDDSTDVTTAVGDMLSRVCKEDGTRPNLSSPSSYSERHRRPFTAVLASPRGYARDAVWQNIVAVLNETHDAGLRDTCRRALVRLVPTSGQLAPELLGSGDLYLGPGLCIFGNDADVERGKASAEGNVYRAFKTFKTLINHLKAPEARQRIVMAFVTWKYLDHPRLLPFLGVQDMYKGRDNTYTTYIVSPWIQWDKRFIDKKVKSKLRNATFRRRCITEIVEGMIYLHRMGVVHGSLRAANIFMDDDEHILIADYGTWHFATGVKGRERWTAPELWDRLASHRLAPVIHTMQSDIWSFACLYTELYTGHVPWGDKLQDSEVEDAIRLRSRYPPRPDDMEDEIWEILERCWVRDPARRPDFVTIGQWLAKGSTSNET